MWSPADWIELVRAIFYGVATICVPLATGLIMVAAARARRAEEAAARNATAISAVSSNIQRLEKNTNSISERNQAIAKALGVTEGIAQERAGAVAHAAAGAHSFPAGAPSLPVPVADNRTAEAAERVAAATERVATATEEKT